MPVILYKLDGSPPSRAVNMTVELIGLKVETREVNSIAGETRKPEFVAKTPLHKIPIIEDGDFTLSDSHAIITYLVSKYGADKRAQLYPSDLAVRATVDQRLYMDATILFPKFGGVMQGLLRDKVSELSAEQVAEIEEAYGFLETYLQGTRYLVNDNITLADVSCVATVSTLDILVPIDQKYPKLIEWFNNIKEKDWYQKGNEPGLAVVKGIIQNMLNTS